MKVGGTWETFIDTAADMTFEAQWETLTDTAAKYEAWN